MKHSPLYIPTDGVAVVIDAHGFRNSEPLRQRPCVCTNSDGLCVSVVMALYCCTLADLLHMISTRTASVCVMVPAVPGHRYTLRT